MGDRGGTDIASLMVSIVALVVSLVALGVATAQLTQQCIATAVGYANCGERVMGPWARFTKLRFRPRELRFEVLFDAPTFIVIMPNNPANEMLSSSTENFDDIATGQTVLGGLLAAKLYWGMNSMPGPSATWLSFMSVLSYMETESREWHALRGRPKNASVWHNKLSIGVQRTTHSLETMPDGVKKPFATIVFSDLILTAAMLGVHWKQFDRREDRYLAEGNGCLITGSNVPFLGIMFSFRRYGRSDFTTGRVIPGLDLRPYCFGYAPTIFLEEADNSRNLNAGGSMGILTLSTREKTAEWMSVLGCQRKTCRHFLDKWEGNTRHVFPVVFELLGMIGATMHIPDADFCVLPNPTAYRWDPSCSIEILLERFIDEMMNWTGWKSMDPETHCLLELGSRILHEDGDQEPMPTRLFVTYEPVPSRLQVLLHDAIGECDVYLTKTLPRRLILTVLRAHFDAVLDLLNDDASGDGGKGPETYTTGFPQYGRLLMDVYVESILPKVISRANLQRGIIIPLGGGEPVYEEPKGAEAWAVLMLRMLCWLWLHDFHPDDVQVASKGDLLDSNLPVYIS